MNIGFDLDDTIIDHTENKIRLAAKFGYQLNEYEVQGNVFDDHVPQPDHLKQIKKELYGSYTLQAKPMPECINVLQKLSNQSHDLYIISRRPKDHQIFAKQWIEKNIPVFKDGNIIFVLEDNVKRKVIKDLSIDLYMDDKIKIIKDLQDITKPVLFVSPFNTELQQMNIDVKIIHHWSEFIDFCK